MSTSNSSNHVPANMQRKPATRETNEVDKFVGERIRLYRAMLGISQQKLAGALGITFQQLQKYEHGENRIGAGRLLAVANILGIPITFLLDEQAFARRQRGDGPAEADMPAYLREGYHVGRAFSQISDPAVRRTITTLVKSLADDEKLR
ncbi:MAG: helix-turn-helix domain-containing protein [Alphaproteobacteria bacterium]